METFRCLILQLMRKSHTFHRASREYFSIFMYVNLAFSTSGQRRLQLLLPRFLISISWQKMEEWVIIKIICWSEIWNISNFGCWRTITVHLRRMPRRSVQMWLRRSGIVETNEKEDVNGEWKRVRIHTAATVPEQQHLSVDLEKSE